MRVYAFRFIALGLAVRFLAEPCSLSSKLTFFPANSERRAQNSESLIQALAARLAFVGILCPVKEGIINQIHAPEWCTQAASEGKVEKKIAVIDEVMTQIEEEIKAEVGDKYFRSWNLQYAGTLPSFGQRTIRLLEEKGLMGPDSKFGDIGAGIGRMLALSVALTEVGEAVGFETESYLIKKGRKAIDELDHLGILDKARIRWVQGDWRNHTKEIRALSAAYIYPPADHEDVFESWGYFVRGVMRPGSYLINATDTMQFAYSGPGGSYPTAASGDNSKKEIEHVRVIDLMPDRSSVLEEDFKTLQSGESMAYGQFDYGKTGSWSEQDWRDNLEAIGFGRITIEYKEGLRIIRAEKSAKVHDAGTAPLRQAT